MTPEIAPDPMETYQGSVPDEVEHAVGHVHGQAGVGDREQLRALGWGDRIVGERHGGELGPMGLRGNPTPPGLHRRRFRPTGESFPVARQ
jgi:hypothetical protein